MCEHKNHQNDTLIRFCRETSKEHSIYLLNKLLAKQVKDPIQKGCFIELTIGKLK